MTLLSGVMKLTHSKLDPTTELKIRTEPLGTNLLHREIHILIIIKDLVQTAIISYACSYSIMNLIPGF